jgi:hypothetical protein
MTLGKRTIERSANIKAARIAIAYRSTSPPCRIGR